MSTFKYGDDKIGANDIMLAVPSMVIAIGILTLPNALAQSTRFSDGWVSIMLAGFIAIFFTWAIAKLASKFPNQSFLSYSATLVSKPVAYLLTSLFAIHGILITAFEVRMITDISHEYLFNDTPIEVVAITFLLVVVYAISGSRATIFRLNAMFIPIIFFITILLIIFSINFMKSDNLLPVFTTGMNDYVIGTKDSILAYSGFGILFFYIAIVKEPIKAPNRAAFGMAWVVGLYVIIYLTCIAVFGQATTEVIRLPLIELAKSVEIPGGFLERMESVFFVIWVTAIFTTTMIAFDITVFALHSIFPKVKKVKVIFSLVPFIFYLTLIPDDYLEMIKIGHYLGYISWGLSLLVAMLLWIMYGIKGGKQDEK